MKYFYLVTILFALSGCCEKPSRMIVEKSFVVRDSVEISIGRFLAIGVEKGIKESTALAYFDFNLLEYERCGGSTNTWYYLYANGKKYNVGFYNHRMFAFF